ncbi:group II intron maturase-specific domain-containing protein [Anaerotaenia torta]|uniref:group II intron maturase-specific domain-containing protein n=1 Tax=Anaerotaenia torta TaxID=433293 RepID=UPI003D2580D5
MNFIPKGQVPKYYVEDSHEAIIPKDIFLKVQEEIARRANLTKGTTKRKRIYSGRYALSGIVFCAYCGDIFRRIKWNNRGCIARPLAVTIKRVNEITRGWINYFRIGMMKQFMEDFGAWLRHKIRVIVMKQWKKPKTIYRNLCYLNRKYNNGFKHEDIYKVANSRLGWYKKSGMNAVNFIISPELLENKIKDGAGLLNPLNYYLRKVGI